MAEQIDEDGIYRIPAMRGLFRTVTRELADAVPPLASGKDLGRFGWVMGALPTPDTEGRYVVEFVEKRAVRVLAYLDRYGRAFTTDAPLDSPPAREPDLRFARYADQPDPDELQGCVEVRDGSGAWREVARFSRRGERYRLFDCWYDFGEHAFDLGYPDALARSYLAFVQRPALGAPEVPARGLEGVEEPLDALPALPALRKLENDIVHAQWDPGLRPPALARALAAWLGQAGLGLLAAAPSGALRLVKTVRYADIFYLAATEEGAALPSRVIWKLQNALNRYLLAKRALGERASAASEADVLRCDEDLVESFAADAVAAVTAHEPAHDGEWDLRRAIAEAVERIAMPLRFEVEFRADVEAGIVSFMVVAPDADMMPANRWDAAAESIAAVDGGERAAQALRYAERIAAFLASVAFAASDQVARVEFSAYRMREENSLSLGDALAALGEREADGVFGESAASAMAVLLPAPDLRVTLERATVLPGLAEAASGDPAPLFEKWGAQVAPGAFEVPNYFSMLGTGLGTSETSNGVPSNTEPGAPFKTLSSLPSAQLRRDMPEFADGELPETARTALGARWAHDLRIDAAALHRRDAELLADRLAPVTSATDAIRVVRRRQQQADDPFVDRACTRLMAGLAEGAVDPEDQNTVVRSYLGRDKCRDALLRARDLAHAGDVGRAGAVLSDAAWEAESEGRFIDDAEVVYRNFDNYSARVLYNLMREGEGSPLSSAQSSSDPAGGAADRDKRVELVPDTLLRCHMEASKLLERSFSGMDSALAHAKRAVELAPTATAPRCLLARVYMLMGDMASASETLEEGLALATQPNDIALAYYQLAYTRWKAGDARVGAACYVKPITTSPLMAAQAATELQDLLSEGDVQLPTRTEVDEILKEAGVPLAPTDEVLDALSEAAKQAVDAGVFPVGRSLLATCLSFRPDDALMGVYRSLIDILG